MTILCLTATLAGVEIAVPADQVESVVRVGAIVPVPRAAGCVVGLFAVRSRVLTLVDALVREGRDITGAHALLLTGEAEGYALLVDAVSDIAAADAAPMPAGRLDAPWRDLASGVIDIADTRRVLIDAPALMRGLVQQAQAA